MDIHIGKVGREQRIAQVDQTFVDPKRRAQYLYAKLIEQNPQPTMWDMTCFSVEYIGMLSLIEPAFAQVAAQLNAILYEAHYIHGRDLASCLSPSLTKLSELDPKDQAGAESGFQSMELTPP